MDAILQKWFGDDVELSEVSGSSVVLYVNRDQWISARTVQHILLMHNWSVSVLLNENGRSCLAFSQSAPFLEQTPQEEKHADSTKEIDSFLRSLFGSTTHIISASKHPVGSTIIVSVSPTHTALRVNTALLTQILDHPRTFDVHIKHNKLVVMATLPASSPLSLSVLLRQRRFSLVKHASRQQRQKSINRGLKKIARQRLSNLRRNKSTDVHSAPQRPQRS